MARASNSFPKRGRYKRVEFTLHAIYTFAPTLISRCRFNRNAFFDRVTIRRFEGSRGNDFYARERERGAKRRKEEREKKWRIFSRTRLLFFVRRLTSGNSCELVTPSRRGSFDGIMAECRWRQLGEKIRKRMSRSESKRISIKSGLLKK